jgi:hypothetical protein
MRVGKGRKAKAMGIKGEEGWQNLRALALVRQSHVLNGNCTVGRFGGPDYHHVILDLNLSPTGHVTEH